LLAAVPPEVDVTVPPSTFVVVTEIEELVCECDCGAG